MAGKPLKKAGSGAGPKAEGQSARNAAGKSNKINRKRLIPVSAVPRKEALAAMESGAWSDVDRRAKEEIARRHPPADLVTRAGEAADILEKEFPSAACALHFSTGLELLVATILSAQCTDARVNLVAPSLFRRYRTAAEYAESPPGELEEAIRSTGFFNNKAKSIRGCCRRLVEEHGGEVPREMEALSALPGVGRKTAGVVRANVFGLPGITVDTHFQRIMGRLGLSDDSDPERIEFDIGSLLPPERWSHFSHAVILHGRKTCGARKPDCAACALQGLCPSAGRFDL